jgi:two-component system, OmpR family, phosphate regulon sensor histidine kinase PhoR
MNWFIFTLVTALVIVLVAMIWSNITFRRRLERFSESIRRAADENLPITSLVGDMKGFDELSTAIKFLAHQQQTRLSNMDIERAKLAAVLERMTDGVLIADEEGRIQFTNPAAENLFEIKDAVGRTVVEVLRHHKLVEAWQRSRATGEPQDESLEIPTRKQFLQLVVQPDEETGGSLLLVQNLTRIRRLETIRRDFISNVSHELRTPLASLKALTETLCDGAMDDPQAARKFLGRIETEVDALAQMTQELLELTRIESGQVPLEMKDITAEGLLLSAADRMRAQVERAGLVIRLDSSSGPLSAHADPTRLEQVLVNLIHNAVKFTQPGGEVVLSARALGDMVCFAVKDTGVGIPTDDLERIFERFYKADRARSGGGTGLGLSIARHIVEAHGGKIWAESVEGEGSTFFFTIPQKPNKN